MLEIVGFGNDWLESAANLPKNPLLPLQVPTDRGVALVLQLGKDWGLERRSLRQGLLSPWHSCVQVLVVHLYPFSAKEL